MRLKKNVGARERQARIGLGVAALVAALSPRFGRGRWLLAAVGLVSVATGRARYCPINQLAGIDNSKGRELIHFAKSRRVGRRLNRLQHRLGATL